uniref:Matrix-remodeling-associated protein 7 helical domain-containing protein n=1 Tax=Stomoxys calcitrans TaxID=35570 RepID=A0A1I8Q8B2_STOCA
MEILSFLMESLIFIWDGNNIERQHYNLTEQLEDTEEVLQEDYVQSDTSNESEIENHYFSRKEPLGERHSVHAAYDECNSDDDYEDDHEIASSALTRNLESSDFDSDDYDEDIHADGLVGKLKSKRVKELEARLTIDQLEEERRIEREQLAAIFELLKKQEAELNMKEIDENELNAQLGLYR